jgi:hypothetical protein
VTLAAFDPLRAFEVLAAHRVRFVVIGGFAARLWGSPTVTNDLDLCYARDDRNLEALAAVLVDLDAAPRGSKSSARSHPDAEMLRAGDRFAFKTRLGNLDCCGLPAGSGGFDQLARTAATMDLGRATVKIASLEDLIRMKRAVGRPKDLIEAEILKALQDELENS